jgi:hypothetical protein
MPWGSKSELPKELQELDPAEIVAAVKDRKTLQDKLTAAETELRTTKSAFETFQGEFDSKVEAKVTEMVTNARRQVDDKNKPAPLADFITDPDQAFAQRIAPVLNITLETAAYSARNAAREKFQRLQRANPGKNFDGYFFDKFEEEINNLAKSVPVNQRANPEAWEHLFYNIKGRHSDEIAAQFREGKLDNIIESGTAGAGRAAEPDKNDKLTPQQERIAAKLGLKPEDYLKQQQQINASSLGVTLNV